MAVRATRGRWAAASAVLLAAVAVSPSIRATQETRPPLRSTAGRWSIAIESCCARSTPSHRSRSATGNSPSPSMPRGCRRFRTRSSRRPRSAPCRTGDGTRHRTRATGASRPSVTRSSTATAGPWATPTSRATSARRRVEWLRANPHRLHLGRIGFRLTKADGTRARPGNLSGVEQTLDVWSGTIVSRFTFDGAPVEVRTVSSPVTRRVVRAGHVAPRRERAPGHRDPLSVRHGQTVTADWTRPDAHTTTWSRPARGGRLASRAAWTPMPTRWRRYKHQQFRVARRGRATPVRAEPGAGLRHARADGLVYAGQWSGVSRRGAPRFAVVAAAAAHDTGSGFWTTGAPSTFPAAATRAGMKSSGASCSRGTSRRSGARAPAPAGDGLPQQLGRQVPPGDALVARRAFAAWDRIDCSNRSLILRAHPAPRPRHRHKHRVRGRPLAKDDRAAGAQSPRRSGPSSSGSNPTRLPTRSSCIGRDPDRATLEQVRPRGLRNRRVVASFAHRDEARHVTCWARRSCAQEQSPKDPPGAPPSNSPTGSGARHGAGVARRVSACPRTRRWDRVLPNWTPRSS